MLCWKRKTSNFLNFFPLPKKNKIGMAELNRSYLYLYMFLWVLPTLDFPWWQASNTRPYFSLATYSVKIQFSTVSLLQSCSFWTVFRNFRLPAFTWTARANCCPQPETLNTLKMPLFIPVQTKRFKLIITCCSVPAFDELLPGFRDVRMSLHGWQYNAPSGACFGHMKLRDWFCDSWNFFKKPNFLVVDSAVGKSLFLDRLALVVSGKTRHPFFQPWSKHSKKRMYFFH